MSLRPNDPFEFSSPQDLSGDFGRNEGYRGFGIMARRFPDQPIGDLAEQAIRLSMIVAERFEVDTQTATEALIGKLFSDFPSEMYDLWPYEQIVETDPEDAWHEIKINLASSDERVRNLVSWLIGLKGTDRDSEVKYEYMTNAACRQYDLDPDEYLGEVMDLCEQRLLEEPLDD